MTEAVVLVDQTAAVRTLTLNRPAALNSFTAELHAALLAALNAAAADTATRCVILTGAGRAFCGGQDLSDPMAAPNPASPPDLGVLLTTCYDPLIHRLRTMPVPTIAAVNGVAAGAGVSVALHCDLVLAATSASFIQAFTKIGLIPDSGGTWLLPRLVGRANALGLALLGDRLSAADAQQMGLIWKCVDGDGLLAEAHALAARLAAMPVPALVATRVAIDDAQGLSLTEALALEASLQRTHGFSNDYQEGVAAFMEKRPPTFTDR